MLIAAAVFLLGAATGIVLATRGGRQQADVVNITRAASAKYYGPIVYYSGRGTAGVHVADPYSGWEFVDNNAGLSNTYSDWTAGKCSPDRADDFPSDRGLHI